MEGSLEDFKKAEADREALREKYRAERDKRLRPDGSSQYVAMEGLFADYRVDPYVEPGFTREPIVEDLFVLVAGGGFSGLLAGARLRQAGIDDFRIVERAGDFGGTWYWNRYPGAACDTESYVYMPLLEETGYIPTRKYAGAIELFEHSQRIGRHFDLYDRALFQTVMSDISWNDETKRWLVTTDRGDRITAKYIILANGGLDRPKLPGIPGLENFRGHSFHTSRWDYSYTGGNRNGGLNKLQDKRVAIIGTGATAVQAVPHLAEWSKELYVFQRTPSSVDERNDRPTDPEWVKTLKPGWQKERMENFTDVISGSPFDVDLVNDGWTQLITAVLLPAKLAKEAGQKVDNPEALVQEADFRKMEQVRSRIDSIVKDPKVAEALKPWYNQMCKRPCFHDEYLQSFNRPNVHLIDTDGKGVEQITEHGIVVNDVEYPVDCIIYSTGFEVGTDYTTRMNMSVHGRNGLLLSEAWRDGPETLYGMLTHGFPNLFFVNAPQGGWSANFQHVLNEQTQHIVHLIRDAEAKGVQSLEPSAEAQSAWVESVVKYARRRLPFMEECTPGYYNNEGALSSLKNSFYNRSPNVYFQTVKNWIERGDFEGLDLTF